MLIRSEHKKRTDELSGVVVGSSGDLQPDPQIEVEYRRRVVSIATIALALVNIGLEATLQILVEFGTIQHRGAVMSVAGVGLVAFCMFTIPFRERWTVIVNAGILVLYLGYCLWLLH